MLLSLDTLPLYILTLLVLLVFIMQNIPFAAVRLTHWLGSFVSSSRPAGTMSRSVETLTETLEAQSISSMRKLTASLGNLTGSGTEGKTRTVKLPDAERFGKTAYKYEKKAIGNRLTQALNDYLAEAPEQHGEYLRNGFLRISPIRQFLAGNPKKREGYHIDKVKMPDSYEKFQEVITLFLNGLTQTDSLYMAFNNVFKETNFDIQRVTDGDFDYQINYVGLTSRTSHSESSLLERAKSVFSKAFTTAEPPHKSHVIKQINKANERSQHLINQTKLLRQFVKIHGNYIESWRSPVIEPVNFETLTTATPKDEDTLEALQKMQADIEKENGAIQREFIVLFNSLHDTDNNAQLMTLPEEMPLATICQEMESVLKLTPGWRDSIRRSWVFCRQGYADEHNRKAILADELGTLIQLFQEPKDSALWGENIDKAAWSQHFMVLWLRRNLPDALCKIGRIKCSSTLRKAWKGKLNEWEISWKPRVTGAHTTAVTPTCFQGFSRR